MLRGWISGRVEESDRFGRKENEEERFLGAVKMGFEDGKRGKGGRGGLGAGT